MYDFGGFRLDPAQHLLLHEGEPVSLAPKAFELLVVLVESEGRLLTKDELMRQLWPNSFVEEANLTVNVSALRKALGDTLDGQAFIETVPKHGYRFIAAVSEVPRENKIGKAAKVQPIRSGITEAIAPSTEIGAANEPPPHPIVPRPSRARLRLVAVAVILGIVLAGVFYSLYRQRSETKQALNPPRRLAILPFQNLRHDPDTDFLGYSLADAVITKLSYVQQLRVRPSYAVAKYRDTVIDVRKVADDLNVDTLLMGNFIRDGDDLRITCQLVDAASQNILWRNSFDLKYDKLLTVHDQVAQQIIKELEPNLSASAEVLKPDKPVDPMAYEYYLRGVDLYSRNQFPTAVKMLEKSSEMDPQHALTWAYLGRSYNASASFEFGGREDYRKARIAFEKALALQPTQIEANVYLANWFTDTGRVEEAVPLLRNALKTNPDHAEVHWELGYAYRFAGMLTESAAECERARELDPGVKLTSSALNAYLYLGEYEKFLSSLPASGDSAFISFYRGFGEYYEQKFDLASRDFDRAFEIDSALMQARIGKALSYRIANQNEKGLQILSEAEGRIRQRGVGDPEALYKIAQAYAVLGDHASALRVYRTSIENGFFPYPYFATDPLLNNLRDGAEFTALMKVARIRHEAFRSKFF